MINLEMCMQVASFNSNFKTHFLSSLFSAKDLEKSLESKCLTRTLQKKSYYMKFKLINQVIKAYNSYFIFKVHVVLSLD